jgi:lipopolysaccharide export system protein LptC
MSSHTDLSGAVTGRRARYLTGWARIAPLFSWLAAGLGVAFLGLFLLQAGFFALLLPDEPGAPPAIENPADVTSYETRLTGFDKDNQPYWVTAARGRQDDKNRDIMHLEQVAAQFSSKAGAVYDVTAESGKYSKKHSRVDLAGDVVIRQGDRFTARMNKARAFIKRKQLSSNVAVAVTFADGTIHAKGLQITDDGNTILFFNGVHARFGGPAKKGDKAP